MTFSLSIRTAEDLTAQAAATARARLVTLIDQHIEARAQTLGYNSAAHLAGYAASTVPDWAAEAQRFIAWRDAAWQAVFALQIRHAAAQTVPDDAEVLAALPGWG